MAERKKPAREPEIPLAPYLEKRGRGRPSKIGTSEVFGRAQNYAKIFRQIWPQLRDPLSRVTNGEEVTQAFQSYAETHAREFVPRLSEDILKVIHGPKFPKRIEAQIHFLADSLAGRPSIEPRTSRDICGKERAKEGVRSPYKILRKEYYIECSCGYKGPARNDACRKCGAQISYLPEFLLGI